MEGCSDAIEKRSNHARTKGRERATHNVTARGKRIEKQQNERARQIRTAVTGKGSGRKTKEKQEGKRKVKIKKKGKRNEMERRRGS